VKRFPGNLVDPPSPALDKIGCVMFPGGFPEGCQLTVLDQTVTDTAAFPVLGHLFIDRGECLSHEVTPFEKDFIPRNAV